jgi:hypothetical protein
MHNFFFRLVISVVVFLPGLTLAANAKFSCDSIKTGTCYFTLFYKAGGIRNFTLKAGESDLIPIKGNDDTFCLDTTGVPKEKTCNRKPVKISN